MPLGRRLTEWVEGSPTRPPLRQRLGEWFRGWPTRPREPLGWRDLVPNAGRLFVPCVAAATHLFYGGYILFGPHRTFRLGGLLSFAGGALLAALVILYVRRPAVRGSRCPGVGR